MNQLLLLAGCQFESNFPFRVGKTTKNNSFGCTLVNSLKYNSIDVLKILRMYRQSIAGVLILCLTVCWVQGRTTLNPGN